MKNFLFKLLIFIIPVILTFTGVEFLLRNLEYSVTVKKKFFEKNKNDIKILALGSSHYERGINPKYLNPTTLNLSNSGQRVNENFELLKKFVPELPNLKLIVLDMSYDLLERSKKLTSPIIDVENLMFYNVNTYERDINIIDHSIFLTDPDYFSHRIIEYFKDSKDTTYNKFGFDKTKFSGSYQAVNHIDSLILDKDIYLENAEDREALKNNTQILMQLLQYCLNRNLDILIYNPPVHSRFNQLRKKEIVKRRDSILNLIKTENPEIKIFNDEAGHNFGAKYFYNGDHLNPTGAKKSTLRLKEFIINNY